jgi:pimeloyl-ACP methyl ester carboxylesterase
VSINALCLALVSAYIFASAPAVAGAATDVTGVWQGTLPTKTPLRLVLKINRDENDHLQASLYSIDQTPNPIKASAVEMDGSALTVVVASIHGEYQGTLSDDGTSMHGNWTQGRSFELNLQRTTQASAWPIDPSVKNTQLISVQPGVKLEVLDWGGSGPPIVLLAGEGDTAHVFSRQGFAQALTTHYHVYGITRRGYGDSSSPAATHENYSSDRLGDDVVAVIDALHLNRPVLMGHSVAGEELSSVGTYHPASIAGLIYLDAAYAYAFYDVHGSDNTRIPYDSQDVIADLKLNQSEDVATQKAAATRLLTELPRLENDLKLEQIINATVSAQAASTSQPDPIGTMIDTSGARYSAPISLPILAIYAAPHDWSSVFGTNAAANATATRAEYSDTLKQIEAFKRRFPAATVVVIPNADHYVFFSNQAQTLRVIESFLHKVWPSSKS